MEAKHAEFFNVFIPAGTVAFQEVCSAAPEFFGDPDGIISSLAMAKKWVFVMLTPLGVSNLINLVVSESPPALSKVQTSVGHQSS